MFRLFLFIGVLIASLTIHGEVDAANSYTPGATIAMTGSNSSVRFDVANDLIGFDATMPTLITATKRFSGTFYGSGIGWIEFSTGSYQVGLNCGGQYLSGLTIDCTLTGTGWSENVGDIYFNSGATVIYNPSTGYLSGSAMSFVGEIDLSGIILPLRPVTINESTTLIANHNTTLSVSGASLYDGGVKSWEITITPILSPVGVPVIGAHGVFVSSDLSLATTYDVVITDTNESKTQFSLIVTAGAPTTTLVPGSYNAKDFCNAYSGSLSCPDGDTRIASTHSQTVGVGSVANGTDKYSYITKIRDGYGNRVTSGDIKIKYITTVKNIQIDSSENLSIFLLPTNLGDGDAFISSELGSGLGGSTPSTSLSLGVSDTSYSIASTAPTNTTDNIIRLDSIKYLSGGIESPLMPSGPTLTFSPLFTASTTSPNPPIVGVPNLFLTTVTQNISTTIIPTIISTLKIGAGGDADWRILSSSPAAICTNYPLGTASNNLCDWNDPFISSIATSSNTNFILTGSYIPNIPSTLIASIIKNYISYSTGSIDILYPSISNNISQAQIGAQRIRLLGQSSESLSIGSQNRVSIINSLRERISLLSRNRTDYTGTNYTIQTGNITITDANFADKRTIISIGGDITIASDISLRTHPLAIIALTNSNNQGGNITISGSVSDIHSILVAEHGIRSESSLKQLYIHGSMISANPPQEAIPTICPYFASGCIPSDYDLPLSRYGFSIYSSGGLSYPNSLIIAVDTRVTSDPPPAFSK